MERSDPTAAPAESCLPEEMIEGSPTKATTEKDECFMPFLQDHTARTHGPDMEQGDDTDDASPPYFQVQPDHTPEQLLPLETDSVSLPPVSDTYDSAISPVDSEITDGEIAMYKRDNNTGSTVSPLRSPISDAEQEAVSSSSTAPVFMPYDERYLYAYETRRASEPNVETPGIMDAFQSRRAGSLDAGVYHGTDRVEEQPEAEGTAEAQDDGTIGVEISVPEGSRLRAIPWWRNKRASTTPSVRTAGTSRSSGVQDGEETGTRPGSEASKRFRRRFGSWSWGHSTKLQHPAKHTPSSERDHGDGDRDLVGSDMNPNEWRRVGYENRPKSKAEKSHNELPPMSIVIFIVGSRGKSSL